MSLHIAFFVTSHGFGHAARACAVMHQLRRMRADLHFHLFTSLPPHVFPVELTGVADFHQCSVDVGVRQSGALDFDWAATSRALGDFLSDFDERAAALALELQRRGCAAVLCDIAPFGIAVAKQAGLPVALIENFSWSWIYAAAQQDDECVQRAIHLFDVFRSMADLKILASPGYAPGDADSVVPPISRPVLSSPDEVRRQFGIAHDERLILVSLGGFQYPLERFAVENQAKNVRYLILGQRASWRHGQVTSLSAEDYVYLPDIVAASDALVTKLGYSTLAEAWMCDTPVAYVSRPAFAENAILEPFVEESMCALRLAREELDDGRWMPRVVNELLLARSRVQRVSGALRAAHCIVEWLAASRLGKTIRAAPPRGPGCSWDGPANDLRSTLQTEGDARVISD